jgi:spore maturation protein CgeB
VHVPRRPYSEALPGIPTIRVFEALACGIPLVCSPWRDEEGLFPQGAYLSVNDEHEMYAAFSRVLQDDATRDELVQTGLRAIAARHTCAHRIRQLLGIVEELTGAPAARAVQAADLALEGAAS